MSSLAIFAKEGISLLTNYKSYKGMLSIRCSKGHITKTSVNKATLRVSRDTLICTDCQKEIKQSKTKENVRSILANKNYKLVSEQVDYDSKFEYECDKGHKHSMHISNLMNGKGCPTCFGNRVISFEEIKEVLFKETN